MIVKLKRGSLLCEKNIIVKKITRKVYAIVKNIVASTRCAFEGWSIFKVTKPSMWYVDDNLWEYNNKEIVT